MTLTIQSLLTPPDSWQWGEFYNKDNNKIRYGWNTPKNARGLIVIAEGRTEVIEEYFETIHDLNSAGFACAIMDWQGQGLSYRLNDDNSRHHSMGFDHDMADFGLFLAEINKISAINQLSKILFAHSMGGNVTLRYMADNPPLFTCAIMVAPMLGLNPKRIIKILARPLLSAMKKLKYLEKYAPGQSKWNETFANIAKFKVSSDPVRREVQPYLFVTRPELQCGGVTYGWLAEALKSITQLHTPEFCARIKTPIFIAIAGKDIVVDNDGTQLTASLLPDCQVAIYSKSEHQIHRERDATRDKLTRDILAYIEKHLPT